jgi:hypothetical protein
MQYEFSIVLITVLTWRLGCRAYLLKHLSFITWRGWSEVQQEEYVSKLTSRLVFLSYIWGTRVQVLARISTILTSVAPVVPLGWCWILITTTSILILSYSLFKSNFIIWHHKTHQVVTCISLITKTWHVYGRSSTVPPFLISAFQAHTPNPLYLQGNSSVLFGQELKCYLLQQISKLSFFLLNIFTLSCNYSFRARETR